MARRFSTNTENKDCSVGGVWINVCFLMLYILHSVLYSEQATMTSQSARVYAAQSEAPRPQLSNTAERICADLDAWTQTTTYVSIKIELRLYSVSKLQARRAHSGGINEHYKSKLRAINANSVKPQCLGLQGVQKVTSQQ